MAREAPPTHAAATASLVSLDTVVGWARSLPRRLLGSPGAFAHYLRTCVRPTAALIQGAAAPDTVVWPCPPPFPWGEGEPPSCNRRRSRWKVHAASRVWTNLFVIALSFLQAPAS